MADFKYTRRVKDDVSALAEYIARDSHYAANDFACQLIEKFSALAESPHMGRERDDYGSGIRTFPFGNYMIFTVPWNTG